MTFQTLDSEDLVPMTTDLSDLIRALSDLCIQAYQQLLHITETRLQNIIGTTFNQEDTDGLPLSAPLISLLPSPQSLPCWRVRPSQVCLALRQSWLAPGSEQARTPGP